MTLVAVGLGSNLGDRIATLVAAVGELSKLAHVERVSSVYETVAIGPPQPNYLNAAVLLEWRESPHALLRALHAIETHFGRVRGERWGPRTLDLDVLWIHGVVLSDEALTVPHPRLHERAFALLPMLEVVPHAIDPRTSAGFSSDGLDRGLVTLRQAETAQLLVQSLAGDAK